MMYVTVDKAGAATGFYDENNHPTLPKGAIALTDEQYTQWVQDHAAKRWSKQGLVDSPGLSISETKAKALAGIRTVCSQHLLAGFPSQALGGMNLYPSDEVSQRNLMAAATLSMAPSALNDWSAPLWCQPPSGIWEFQPHSAPQVQQVATDWLIYRTAAQTRLNQLSDAISSAPSAEDAEAVAW